MAERSDEELLAAHIAGTPGAFEVLTNRYTNELYGFLYRLVGNNSVAEDLIQETFLQVHLAANSFDPARKFKPWIYTIAANKGRDFLRARGRRNVYSLDTAAGEDAPVPGDSLEADQPAIPEQFEAEQRKQTVRQLIERMPEHLRMILILGYYQQLPYAEIAQILDIPVGTVKSRLHAAVTCFAELWDAYSKSSTAVKQ